MPRDTMAAQVHRRPTAWATAHKLEVGSGGLAG